MHCLQVADYIYISLHPGDQIEMLGRSECIVWSLTWHMQSAAASVSISILELFRVVLRHFAQFGTIVH
jgi:hypothetical protein